MFLLSIRLGRWRFWWQFSPHCLLLYEFPTHTRPGLSLSLSLSVGFSFVLRISLLLAYPFSLSFLVVGLPFFLVSRVCVWNVCSVSKRPWQPVHSLAEKAGWELEPKDLRVYYSNFFSLFIPLQTEKKKKKPTARVFFLYTRMRKNTKDAYMQFLVQSIPAHRLYVP